MARIWHGEDFAQEPVTDPAAAERRLDEISELAEAEHAVAEGEASPAQEREVLADAARRAEERRTAAWQRAAERGDGEWG